MPKELSDVQLVPIKYIALSLKAGSDIFGVLDKWVRTIISPDDGVDWRGIEVG